MAWRSKKRARRALGIPALLAGVGWFAAPAHAQEEVLPDKNVGVRDRPRPEYAAPGIPAGTFRLRPDFTVEAAHTDNVFANDANRVSDLVTTLSAGLAAQSQGARLPMTLRAGVDSVSYRDNPSEDYVDWNGGATVSYALPRRTRIAATGDLSRQHESRAEPSFPANATEPPEFEQNTLGLEVEHLFASGSLELTVTHESFSFDDVTLANGGIADQDFRDRDVSTLQIQGNFVLGPSAAIFVRAVDQDRDYSRTGATGGLDRDAKTTGLYAGTVLDLTNLMRGELGLGVLDLDNADPDQADRRSTALSSSLEIFVTQLMTATLSASRSSAAADIPGIASYIGTNAAFRLDYELRRNVILSATLSQGERSYSGIPEKDRTNRVTLGAQWLLTRHARLEAGYSKTDQEWRVEGLGRAYDDQVVTVGATFGL